MSDPGIKLHINRSKVESTDYQIKVGSKDQNGLKDKQIKIYQKIRVKQEIKSTKNKLGLSWAKLKLSLMIYL